MAFKDKNRLLLLILGLTLSSCAQQAFIKKPVDIVRDLQRNSPQEPELDQGSFNPTEPRADFTEPNQNYFKAP